MPQRVKPSVPIMGDLGLTTGDKTMKVSPPHTLVEALARGVRAAETLGAETDALTETLAQIERALDEMRLGVSAFVTLRTEEDEVDHPTIHSVTTTTALSFVKEGKRWMLAIATTHDLDDEWRFAPLVNASRELRLLAVEKLPELIEALMTEAERRFEEVRQGHEKARAILDALVAMRGPEGAA